MLLIAPCGLGHLDYYFPAGLSDRLPGGDGLDGEQRGSFGGRAASVLGVEGRVPDRTELDRLFRGHHPITGATLDSGHRRVRNAFFDCVFTAPKSVSLLFALGDREVVRATLASHEAARDAALGYLERNVAYVQMSPRHDRRVLPADGLVWSSFVHHTSRSGDPHLHSHVLVANLVPSASRGWSVMVSAPLFAEQAAARQLYKLEFRYELGHRLGLSFRRRSGPASDVSGISDRVLEAFSTRSSAIRGHPVTSTRAGYGARLTAGRRARPAKLPEPPREQLVELWWERALRLGVVPGRGPFSDRDSRTLDRANDVDAGALRQQVGEAIATFDRPFSRSEVIRATLSHYEGTATIASVEQAIDEELSSNTSSFDGRLAFPMGAWRAATRFDRGQPAVFVSPPVRESLEREHARQVSAPPLLGRDGFAARGEPIDGRAAYVHAGTWANPVETYAALREIGTRATFADRPISVLGPTRRAIAAFEAATGIEATRIDGVRALSERGLIVLVDAARLGCVQRESLVEEAIARGNVVVALDGPAEYRPSRAALKRSIAGSVQRVGAADAKTAIEGTSVLVDAAGIEVHLADSIGVALTALHRLVVERAPATRAVLDVRFHPLVGDVALAPSDLSSALQHGLGPFVVFGGAASLPVALRDDQRLHVAVTPLGAAPEDLRAVALALAAPERLRTRLGAVRDQPADRRAWGWRATLELDRDTWHELRGLERSRSDRELVPDRAREAAR